MKEKGKSKKVVSNDELLEKKIKETSANLKENYKDLREDADKIVDDIKNSTPESMYFITGLLVCPLALISKDLFKSKTKQKRFNQGALVGFSLCLLTLIIDIITTISDGFLTK